MNARRALYWPLNILLALIALLMFLPFLWMLVISVSPTSQAFTLPPTWVPTSIHFDNFSQVFSMIPFGIEFLNSAKIATIVTIGALTTSALAAYAFTRLEFPGRKILFVVFLSALMVPQQVTVIPIFILMRNLGLLDNHASIILPGLISVLGIFLLRQFFQGIPRDLDEAASIDGAGHLRILVQIILPLSTPALSALGIFIFQLYWNDFFWPNIFLSSPQQMTLPVGLVALQGLYGSSPAAVMFAAIAMIVVPVLILFLFTQRALIESIVRTGLTG